MSDWLAGFIAREALPPAFGEVAARVCAPLAEAIVGKRVAGRPYVVGLCGAQGSGKSTLTAIVRRMLEERGLNVAALSLDDLYLTRLERLGMARDVHPLFGVRGPPGTHDAALGLATLDALARRGRVAIPAFDKGADDRRAPEDWPIFEGPADVVLFEGWCVGARAQADEALVEPLNALERDDDPDGVWRRHANAALAGPYQQLFARIDLLILLAAPGFDAVLAWRREQEAKLRARLAREGGGGRAMDDAQVSRFIAHYERLTRWILVEMPARADIVLAMDADRRVGAMQFSLAP
ncbi:kinase [Phenylobacterium sp.]|uniref:kinase n=1 Tax=Phenylobacterium sp. TaxID=1871053 RepID=UPI002FCBD6BA